MSAGDMIFDVRMDASGFQKDASKLGDIVKGLGVFEIIKKGMSMVVQSIDAAVSRYDTLNRFSPIMQQMGYSAESAEASIEKLSDGVQGLPTTLDSIVSSTQRLAIAAGGLDKGTDTALALNNALFASGAAAEAASRGTEQYIQALSRGKIDAQEWKTLMETMPYAMQQVAKAFGYTGTDAVQQLQAAMSNGEITMTQFNDKLIELNGGVGGFAEVAKTATGGISTAWTNMQTAVVRGTTEVISSIDEGFSQNRFGSIENIIVQFGKGFYSVLNEVAKVAGFVAANLDTLTVATVAVGAAFAVSKGMKTWQTTTVAVTKGANAAKKAQTDLMLAVNKEGLAELKNAADQARNTAATQKSTAAKLQKKAASLKTQATELSEAAATAKGAQAEQLKTAATNKHNAAELARVKAVAASKAAEDAATASKLANTKAQVANSTAISLSQLPVAVLTGQMTLQSAATQAATAATAKFNAALAANPIGVAVVAVAALVAGLWALDQIAKRNAEYIPQLSDKIKEFKETQKEFNKSIAESKAEYDSAIASANENAGAIEVLYSEVERLAKEYADSGESGDELKATIEALNSAAGKQLVYFDEATNSVKGLNNETLAYIRNLKASAIAEVARERMIELARKQWEAEAEKKKIQAEIEALEQQYHAAQEARFTDETGWAQQTIHQYEALQAQHEQYGETVNNINQQMTEVGTLASEQIVASNEAIAESAEMSADAIEEQNKRMEESYERFVFVKRKTRQEYN